MTNLALWVIILAEVMEMTVRLLERDEAVALLNRKLAELEPGSMITVSETAGSLSFLWQADIDPEMIERLEANFARYDDVFRRLAD